MTMKDVVGMMKTGGMWIGATALTIWTLLVKGWKIISKMTSDVVDDWKNRNNYD